MTGSQVDEVFLENALDKEISHAISRMMFKEDMEYDELTITDEPLFVCEDYFITHNRQEADTHGYHKEFAISTVADMSSGCQIIDECRDAFLWT